VATRPLTVLQLLPALEVGGVERGTLQVAEGLVARGHRALVASAGGRLVAELEALGARHFRLPIGRKHPASLALVAPLARLIAAEGVDVVHARSRLPAWLAWWALGRLPRGHGVRFVTGCHGPYTPNGYSAIVARGERVIAISATIRRYLLDHYPDLDPGRIRVVPRGVSARQFPRGHRPPAAWQEAWRREPWGRPGQWVLTLPGRLTRWKGQLDFVTAVARLRALGLPIQGLLAGGAEPRRLAYARELASAIREAGLTDCLHLLGHRDDLREVLAASQAVVSITREPEAFGRTTLEALALGVPVAGYDEGGTGEVLRQAFIEGLCPPGNLDVVIARLAAWWRRPPVVPPLADFALEAMVAGEIAVYEELTGRPPTA
jgi:glycosyltransferase involved in cell wall biosynthesis